MAAFGRPGRRPREDADFRNRKCADVRRHVMIEEIPLPGAVEVMDCERRDDEVERSGRELVLEPLEPQVRLGQSLTRTREHRIREARAAVTRRGGARA